MISLGNIGLSFGARTLFEDVSFRIAGRDRVAFVGSNGAGKSTLLKIIAGIQPQDSGVVAVSKHTTVGYLQQEAAFFEGKTLYDEVYSAADALNRIQEEISETENEIKNFEDTESEEYFDLLNEFSELQERFLLLDGFRLKSKIEKILIGLGFEEEDFLRQTQEFSGGWQMRIMLAKLLLSNPSVLLLDEPTNHLDFESLLWVENYLQNYNGAVVLVSHDRNFLDNITKKTYEISLGKVTEYGGNYSFFVTEKEKRKEMQESRYENQQKYLKQQEKFIERFRYKATKARAVQSRIKQIEKLDLIELEDEETTVHFHFPPATHSGKITIEIEGLAKSYDGHKNVLENLDLIVTRGEKIALVGNNGAGKSTLTRIIAGIEPINKGTVKYGHLVDLKFFAQNQAEELSGEKTVLEVMEESQSGVIVKDLRTILGSFLFRGDDVFKKVRVLSGGEKSRLALAKMLVEPSNFLVLDEPTNHLDMKSKEVLKNALRQYQGSVIVVSHDREFMDGFVSKIIEVKNRNIRAFFGNSFDYIKVKEMELEERNIFAKESGDRQPEVQEVIQEKSHYEKNREQKKRRREFLKVANPVKKRIFEIEAELEKKEKRKSEIEALMSDEEFFRDADKVIEINTEYKEIQRIEDSLNREWETKVTELNELEKRFE
ncbi:MAG: ABC-F family ATP-binding cassette domain-containing protein [Ignavibacteriae bacterium]|nr:ABC-F family ATP-binding cassette domain-containing protein [Ignavibacteriota bacterium]